MDATPIDVPGDGNALRHDIPAPPFPPDVIPVDRVALGAPVDPSVVANPFRSEPAPLAPGQLAPGWKKLFIAGWVGVIAGFGCMWQAARVAGLAPWWLGPETDPRAFVLIALPFVAPVAAVSFAAAQSRFAVFVGVAAGLVSM
ncbi:MAG: hypothetical protein ABIW84_04560, partial [Ilumatobacteraceae bacterium]